MLIKLPWLESRKLLISSALFDIFLVYFYNTRNFFDTFNLLPNRFVYLSFTFFWFFASYISGRYNLINNSNPRNILKFILLSFLILFICCVIYIFINLDFSMKTNDINLILFFFRSSTETTILSIFGLFFINLFSKNNKKINNEWLIISEEEVYEKIKKEINSSKFKITFHQTIENEDLFNINFQKFNGIIIDTNKIKKEYIQKLLTAKSKGINIISLKTFFDSYMQRIPLSLVKYSEIFDNKFIIDLNSFELRIKRCGDIIISILILVISLPILIISSFLIFLDDGFPIFYSQRRNGLKGRPFELIKLRTMFNDSEKDGPQWSKKGDKRITKVGKYLRYTRIDELPQLLMVIKGDMSLIGPRPERPEFDKILEKNIPYYNLRLNTRPGLSGWAQVNYNYGASIQDSENKLSYDIYYLRHFSLFLDFLILLKTIKLIFNASGSQPIS